jgi:hypothetical protein
MPKTSRQIPGTVHASVQIRAALYQQMKVIQAARRRYEGIDPKLSRLFNEALEQYVNSVDPATGLPKKLK